MRRIRFLMASEGSSGVARTDAVAIGFDVEAEDRNGRPLHPDSVRRRDRDRSSAYRRGFGHPSGDRQRHSRISIHNGPNGLVAKGPAARVDADSCAWDKVAPNPD